MTRNSSFRSNVRMMGWITRFIKKCRKTTFESGLLTLRETEAGERTIFRLIKKPAFGGIKTFPEGSKNLNRFIDKDGLFRVKTRLCNRNDTVDFKTLVLLPKFGLGVEQLIIQIHVENNHAGIQTTMGILREQVWIIQTRRAYEKLSKNALRAEDSMPSQ